MLALIHQLSNLGLRQHSPGTKPLIPLNIRWCAAIQFGLRNAANPKIGHLGIGFVREIRGGEDFVCHRRRREAFCDGVFERRIVCVFFGPSGFQFAARLLCCFQFADSAVLGSLNGGFVAAESVEVAAIV